MIPKAILAAAAMAFAPAASAADRPPEGRPLTATEQAAIARDVERVRKTLAPVAQIDFDFSDASIEWIDGFIERHRKDDGMGQVLASYVGEAIHVNFHCDWMGFGEGIGLQCPNDVIVFPFNKVSKQFANGRGDSVWSFYRAIPALIARNRATRAASGQ